MYKIDFHTHSQNSPDGGITGAEYAQMLADGELNTIAVTDHNSIDFATRLQAELGDQIIIGEEIMTNEGEIIGLYLKELVLPNQTPEQTVADIKKQGGLVYIPHPFETVRKGLHPETLERIADQVDIIEVCNGRAFFQDRSQQAVVWARLNTVASAASSDAHGLKGLGKTYTILSELPTPKNLVELLNTATMQTEKPSFRALLYPKYNRLRKKFGGKDA